VTIFYFAPVIILIQPCQIVESQSPFSALLFSKFFAVELMVDVGDNSIVGLLGGGVSFGADVFVGTCVGLEVGVEVGVDVRVEVSVEVGVEGRVGVSVHVGVEVRVGVSVEVGVDVELGVGVSVGSETEKETVFPQPLLFPPLIFKNHVPGLIFLIVKEVR
jgi:hypothetical protein